MLSCTSRSFTKECVNTNRSSGSVDVRIQELKNHVDALNEIIFDVKEQLSTECRAHVASGIKSVMKTELRDRIASEVSAQLQEALRFTQLQENKNFDVKSMLVSLSGAVWPHLQRLPQVYAHVADLDAQQSRHQNALKECETELEGLRVSQDLVLQKNTEQQSTLHELQLALRQPSVKQALGGSAVRDSGDLYTRIRMVENKHVDLNGRLQNLQHDIAQLRFSLNSLQASVHTANQKIFPIEKKQSNGHLKSGQLPHFGVVDEKPKSPKPSKSPKPPAVAQDPEDLVDDNASAYSI